MFILKVKCVWRPEVKPCNILPGFPVKRDSIISIGNKIISHILCANCKTPLAEATLRGPGQHHKCEVGEWPVDQCVWCMIVFVFYYCPTNCHKFSRLKQHIYWLTVSVSQEFGHIFSWVLCFGSVAVKVISWFVLLSELRALFQALRL